VADRYEQKPKTWSLFPMSDEDFRKKEDFYDSKGWDMDKVPTHSGKLILPDGTLVRIEGRLVEGNRGDFWVGGCYIPDSQPSGGGDDRRSRDRGGRDDRRGSRDRDDRRSRDDRGGGRDDRRSDRDRNERSRDDRDRGRPAAFDSDLNDDVPF
jgi:hypothetical protein